MSRKDLNTESGYGYQGFKAANDNFIELYNEIENKADKSMAHIARGDLQNLGYNDIDDVRIPEGNYLALPSLLNYPALMENKWGTLEVFIGGTGAKVQQLVDAAGEIFLIRHNDSQNWAPWRKIITDAPPAFSTATLQSGWTGVVYFGKNQLNQLILATSNLVKGTTAWGTLICTVPNFSSPYNTPIPFYCTDGITIDGIVLLGTGELRIYAPADTTLPSTQGPLMTNMLINLY